ncbi:trypsin-like [Anastrepha ludens]|uniref:trypsin-like n=1 Tax=Anastrepha ludens TaxID=28586 RepID=UPI0023B1FCDB|nr:trypsin-like [Anastrepha ludens]
MTTINGAHVCGGALVSKSVVVSAAQCFEFYDPSELFVRLGTSDYASGGELISIASYKVNENFDFTTMDSDLVVVKLNKIIHKTHKSRSIKVSKKEPKTGKSGVLAGWSAKEQLAEVDVKIISVEDCGSGNYTYSSDDLTKTMICAKPVDAEICGAEPGSPLIVKKDLVGLISWGHGCGNKGNPAVYTDITKFRKWIKKTANELEK